MSIFIKKISYFSSLAFFALLVLLPIQSQAFFSGEATSDTNTFTAGTLAFSVADTSLGADVYSTDPSTIALLVTDSGTIESQYKLSYATSTCATAFYDGLTVTVEKDTNALYTGGFDTLVATGTDDGTWDLSVIASTSIALLGDTCEVTLQLKSWQDNFSVFGNGGFYQEEQIVLTLTAGDYLGRTVVLNEVLPNPEGDDWQGGLQGEWVELYNVGSDAVDVTGWYIEDEALHHITISTASTYNGQTNVTPSGWAVVFMSGAVLNNDGDTVKLYDNNGVLRDSYSYGTSVTDPDPDSNNTPNGGNTNPAGSETSGQEGKSDARIPDGADNWVDPIPTPGAPNVLGETAEAPFAPVVASTSPQTVIVDGTSTSTGTSTVATTTPEVLLPSETLVSSTTASSTEETSMEETATTSEEKSFGFVSDTQDEAEQQKDEDKTQGDSDSSEEESAPEVGKEPETTSEPAPLSTPEVTSNQTT